MKSFRVRRIMSQRCDHEDLLVRPIPNDFARMSPPTRFRGETVCPDVTKKDRKLLVIWRVFIGHIAGR